MNKKDINELDINGFEGPAKNEKKNNPAGAFFRPFERKNHMGMIACKALTTWKTLKGWTYP